MDSFVSILLPVYNGERFLKQTIESVLLQTFTNFELLIFNDGSTDSSQEIIKSFNDRRIKLFYSSENKGIVYRLNFLIEKAKGEYIARIDADDIWYPEKLEKQITYLKKNPDIGMVACFARLIDDNDNDFPTNFKQYFLQEDIKRFLPERNFIIHSSVVIKRDVFEKVGKYRKKYLHTEDYDLWLRFLENSVFIEIFPEVLLNYRISSYSVNFRFRKSQAKNVIRLKFNYWRKHGFKWFYIGELLLNFYYLIMPSWLLQLKVKLFNKYLS